MPLNGTYGGQGKAVTDSPVGGFAVCGSSTARAAESGVVAKALLILLFKEFFVELF
jgi:hypothetical protein